jgi:hypothetical protein
MKTVKFLSIALLAVTFILGSCSKYEEGPALSLRTKKARLAGVWKIEKFVDNDGSVSYPDSGDSGTVEYTKDNEVKATFDIFGFQALVNGEWEFIKDKEWLRVILDFNGQKEVEDSKILRLKNDELWIEDEDGDQTHFIPA